ncbi:hypothetical protein LVJ85_02125 [Neisseria sp. Dent CA1/247]|uniref:hypothetical protein n=1 Tax=Neisseria sp. Dent CA1/247 TaxID=2912675 RepID=UPI001FD1436F|nr:hypothetical protein [Neisseria sp. Dent CA1/247]UOO77319.1 hypothetical protein LVJ85_02125 [Neisseria sp. Dent CA1/247]
MANPKKDTLVESVTQPNPQDLTVEAALKQELDKVQAELSALKEQLVAESAKAKAAERELDALRKQVDKPAKSGNPNKRLVRTASGREFWRAGEKFDGEWREIDRTVIGDEAWQRIIDEPALQTKEA